MLPFYLITSYTQQSTNMATSFGLKSGKYRYAELRLKSLLRIKKYILKLFYTFHLQDCGIPVYLYTYSTQDGVK